MKKIQLLILCLILFQNFTACKAETAKTEKDLKFEHLYTDISWNSSVRLKLIDGLNTLRLGELVHLKVENVSKDIIQLHVDHGVKIYEYNSTHHEWLLVKDKLSNKGNFEFLVYPDYLVDFNENRNSEEYLAIMPDIYGTEDRTIRIIVIGNIMNNGTPTDERVGAYLDITLEP